MAPDFLSGLGHGSSTQDYTHCMLALLLLLGSQRGEKITNIFLLTYSAPGEMVSNLSLIITLRKGYQNPYLTNEETVAQEG